MKFTDDEQFYIWNCVAVTLLMGQIEFDDKSFDGAEEGKPGTLKNPENVKHICGLLGIENWENFQKCLLNQINTVGKDIVIKPLSL